MVRLLYSRALPSLKIAEEKLTGANCVTRARSASLPNLVAIQLPENKAD
jgi:hypothetical protein